MDVGYSKFAAKTNYRSYKYWSYLMDDSIEADVLAMGSSRIVKHFDPAVFDSVAGVKSYNIGMDGAHIPDILARYILYKQRNPLPKVALVNIDYFTLTALSYECREKLNRYRPVSIGQASRISGISPADISVLLLTFAR